MNRASPADGLATQEFWDQFYTQHSDTREWFVSLPILTDLILVEALRAAGAAERPAILHVGCGSSEDLATVIAAHPAVRATAKLLPQRVDNVDVSPIVIEAMRRRQQQAGSSSAPNCQTRYLCADVTDLRPPIFADESYDLVVDKGLVDSMHAAAAGSGSSADNASAAAALVAALGSITRVMKTGASYYIFSVRTPATVLPFLDRPDLYGCDVSCQTLHLPGEEGLLDHPQNFLHVFVMRKLSHVARGGGGGGEVDDDTTTAADADTCR